jgi:hypothetical protein
MYMNSWCQAPTVITTELILRRMFCRFRHVCISYTVCSHCALLHTIFGMIGRGRGEFIWHTAREKKLRNFEQCDFLPLDIGLVYPVCHGSCLGTFT